MKRKLYLAPSFRHTALAIACGLPVASWAAQPPLSASAFSVLAEVPVTGRVLDSKGEGLPGATVLVRGTTIGATTDANGRFSLRAPEGSTLLVSSVGFQTQSIIVTAANASTISVSLRDDAQSLNEVVVVGYGTQERGSVTGAISSVGAADIARQPVADATQAIQGKVSGVTITSGGGAPGGAAGTAIRIRGISSAGNNNPLFVVDGFPLPDNPNQPGGGDNQLNAISPNDIESIDVLKDASATAIYGVRAANGVVIITTKRGKAGKSTVNFDGYAGVQSVARRLNLLNAQQYATINNEAAIAAGKPIVLDKLRDPASLGQGTDWQDLVFRRAQQQNYSLSATGGSEKARYAVSAGYYQQDGVIIGSNFERYTLRANGDLQLNKYFRVGNSISLTHLSDRQITTNDGDYGTVQQMLRIPPTVQPYRPDGYWYQPNSASDNFTEENPLATAQRANQRFTRNRAITTFYAELEPLKGLRFRTNVGGDFIFDEFHQFFPKGPELAGYTQRYITASANQNSSSAPTYLIENTASYDHLFADKHQFTLLLGQSAQQFNFSNVGGARVGYLRNDLQTLNSGPINTQLSNFGTVDYPRALASYFGRLNYEFAGRYIFQAIGRFDGSSRFDEGRKFGFFPGISAGWRISEENFLKGNSAVSNLKLRAGYGQVGNELNAGRYAYLYSVNFGINYPFGPDGAINTGAAPTRLRNPDLRWERNNQFNLGIDFGFINNRLEGSIDVYNRQSPNLIAPVPVSLVSGTYEQVNRNAASAYNRGIDFSLTSHNFNGSNGGFNWTTTANVSAFKSRLESLGVGIPYNGASSLPGTIVRYDVNQPFGAFYGFIADGLIQSQEELNSLNAGAVAGSTGANFYQTAGTAPGDIKFRDVNGDGVITDADRTFIGNPYPNFTFGLTNTLAYKGFDLSFFIQGQQGNDIYNLNRYLTESALYTTFNGTTNVLNRWTGTGTSNDVPRAIQGDPNNNLRVSTHFIEDGSYIRLKNLTFGYTLPANILGRISATQIRVYFTGYNLLTLTHYTGFDPEVSVSGIDRGIYPQVRTLIGGINIGF